MLRSHIDDRGRSSSSNETARLDLANTVALAHVTRTLAQVAGLQIAMLLLLSGTAVLTRRWPGASAGLDALLQEGAFGLVGSALLVSLTATLACLLLAWARSRGVQNSGVPGRLVTGLAGWPQAALLLSGMAAAAAIALALPPLPLAQDANSGWPAIAGLLLVPCFLLLVCERAVNAIALHHLPEAARLCALLRVPAFTLLVLAALAAAAGFGMAIGHWPEWALAVLLLALTAELALRSLAIWFLPAPMPAVARAAIGSLLAGFLYPGAMRPAELAQRMRQQIGLDVSRSWAVSFVHGAAGPVVLGLLVVAWGSTGLTRIGLAERGSYERFGAPVAVLKPGLHCLLPWPFGRVRRLEFGTVHTVSVGADPGDSHEAADRSTADGPPPASANRLWDDQGGRDSSYLIASRVGARESFESVSVDISVLYRIGLDDAAVWRAFYGTVAPDSLVHALSARLLAHFFAERSLPLVLGARREQVAGQMRAALQAELDARQSGLEVVAVIIQSMHPPAGAARAYRSVQAAEITASTRRAEETGRTYGTRSEAARAAHRVLDEAGAAAAETEAAAEVEQWQSEADSLAYRDGGRAFLLERYFSNLRTALGRASLEIVDDRLGRTDLPVIDLRQAGRAVDGAVKPP